MLKHSCKTKILPVSAGFVLIYCLQFLLLPRWFPQYYPVSLEARGIFLLPPMLLCLAGTALGQTKLWHWLIPDALYGLLMWLYNGQGLYGIGLKGVNLDGMTPRYVQKQAGIMILILLAVLFAFQTLLWGIHRLMSYWKKKR